jgi:hypothetical protein
VPVEDGRRFAPGGKETCANCDLRLDLDGDRICSGCGRDQSVLWARVEDDP